MKKFLHISILLLLLSVQAVSQVTVEAMPAQATASEAISTDATAIEAISATEALSAQAQTDTIFKSEAERNSGLSVVGVNDVVNPHQYNKFDYVSDMAALFDYEEELKLNELCLRADKEADLEILVVCVPSIGEAEPFQYSVDLYQRIGIGRNDRGILILVSVNDHYWQIRTGYGAEGQFPDAVCSYIGRNKMVPEFRNDDYAKGITDAVEYIVELATSDAAMAQLKEDMEAQAAKEKAEEERENRIMIWCVVAFFCLIVVMAIFGKKNKSDKESEVIQPSSSSNNQKASSNNQKGGTWGGGSTGGGGAGGSW